MIAAKLEELFLQVPSSDRIRQALRFLADPNNHALPDGRHPVDGSQMYAMVQSYTTQPVDENAKFEAHQKYIDIQYIVSGREAMGWAPLDKMLVSQAYDPEKDVCLGTCPPGCASLIGLETGEAAIFFPQDAHAPKLAFGAAGAVKKIVMKVAIA